MKNKYSVNNGVEASVNSQEKSSKSDVLNAKFSIPPSNVGRKTVPYYKLFRFATISELCAIFIALVLACISSLGIPFAVILYGEFTTLLVDRTIIIGTSTETIILSVFGGGEILTNGTLQENRDAIYKDSKAFGLGSLTIALLQLICATLSLYLVNHSAQRQIARIRKLFLRSIIRQDMTWYDLNSDDNFATRITDDLEKLKEGIGEKLSIFTYLVVSFICSVIFSFFYGWKLTLVILSCAPLIIFATALVSKVQSSLTQKELDSYSVAGSMAEEVLGAIRTVIAFGGEEKEAERYKERLQPAEDNGKKKGVFSGIGGGTMWFLIYCCYALAFWYGVNLILQDRDNEYKEYTPAVLIIVLFGILTGAQNVGMSSPHFEAFASSKASAVSIFNIIDRIPVIDSMGIGGLLPKTIHGDIVFSNVHFKYPARSEVPVLQGLNLTVNSGETVALVGPSGCGKSTCLQLIQRLYDPLNGYVQIDGIKLTELNTAWLRSFIGVVGQEPVLFGTTIMENIRYGNPEATEEEIQSAAKIANCHNFISKLPDGYSTLIGERGALLSGGQKQRIAIARALVRNPKILLLDEATSALDPNSEKLVQDALERATKGRTTLVVSHRLSTITNADKIVFIKDGVVVEQGTHAQLIEQRGHYYDLVNASGSATTEKNVESPTNVSKKRLPSFRKSESVSGDDIDADITEDKESVDDEVYPVTIRKIVKLNTPEWPYLLMGCISALVVGASFPVFAILFGEVYGTLSLSDKDEVQRMSNIYSILFLVMGLVTGLGTFFQTYMFNIAGVRLTSRLRLETFKTMMKQEMAWFDSAKNSVGALCTRLSSDCSGVQGATGTRIGATFQAFSTITVGVGIALYFSWKLTLVSIVTIPAVLVAVFLEARYTASSSQDEKELMEGAVKLAVEAISNIRTVASLCQEPHVIERYNTEMEKVDISCRQKSKYRGLVFAMGQSVPFLGYGLALYYGGTLVAEGEMKYQDVIKVSEALIFGAWMLGQALAYTPNVNTAIISAGRILKLFERKPQYDNTDISPQKEGWKADGSVRFDDIEFRYPSRPKVPVLEGLDLNIQTGQTIALVGPSGCGKSTCVQLLLRYYDPDAGNVKLDGKSTTTYPFNIIRSQLGLVSQEPVLFDRTIAENIAYGDNARSIPMSEIIEAAKMANIHEFIVGIPMGYDTNLGSKGAQLSGGQKQRVAIARALVRNPRVLLLDEATSALDTQSEKVVQSALDAARTGRTCITIAHRFSTVQNADMICVIQNGIIVERGTHTELIELNKIYAQLYSMQQISS